MKSRSGVLLAAVSASIVTALIVGGIAWATIPDSDGVIHGCYAKRDGALRVIDNSAADCNTSKENSLTWNQTGPTGPSGISHAYHAANSSVSVGTDVTYVVSLDNLPAGDYIAFGKSNISGGPAECDLFANLDLLDHQQFDLGRSLLALESAVHLPDGGQVAIKCQSDGQVTNAAQSQLVAIAVDAVN